MKFRADVTSTFECDGQTDQIKGSYDAQYIFSEGSQQIVYYDNSSGERVRTSVTIEPGCVSIDRERADMPALVLKERETRSAQIKSELGCIPIEYTAERVLAGLTEKGGMISLRYRMDLGGAPTVNRVVIRIYEVK